MEYGQHDDALIPFAKIDAAREMPDNCFAYVAVQHGELFGVAGDTLDQELDFGQEFHPESGAFFLIPVSRFVKLTPRLPAEDDLAHYRCQRA